VKFSQQALDGSPMIVDQISLSLDDVDLDALGQEPTPEEVEAWATAYIDRAAFESSLDDAEIASLPAS
jgi:hypothetical protein